MAADFLWLQTMDIRDVVRLLNYGGSVLIHSLADRTD
jgi:hypothetical protein